MVGEGILRSEYNEVWYEVGELGGATCSVGNKLLGYALVVRDRTEIGWLERVGGEGLFSVSKGLRENVVKLEW